MSQLLVMRPCAATPKLVGRLATQLLVSECRVRLPNHCPGFLGPFLLPVIPGDQSAPLPLCMPPPPSLDMDASIVDARFQGGLGAWRSQHAA